MQTYSHFILTAVLRQPVKARTDRLPHRWPVMRTGAILLGSIIPDLPLTLVAIFTIARDQWIGAFDQLDFDSFEPGMPIPPEWLDISLTLRLFEVWFFENPWMITFHNLFHSPLLVAIYIGVAYGLWQWKVNGAGWFFWLSCAAMLHTLIDIPLHTTDGPLLLFPLNWTWRFQSPISYWDPRYYGTEWSYFEHTLDAVLLIILVWRYWRPILRWLRQWFTRTKANAA